MAAERERDQTRHLYDDYTSDEEEEDYIDMEVSSNSNCNSNWFFTHSSSASTREFEFQMLSASSNSERETTTSPADELFYKGKLLPLHLPPRLQMVEKLLLQNSNNHIIDKTDSSSCLFEECFSTPLPTNTFTTPLANTPFESCNISPSESCQVSRELNPDDYFFHYSGAIADDDITIPKKSCWTRKLGSKLKASRAYLKSLFSKPGDQTFAVSKAKESLDNKKHAKKSPFGQIQMPAAGSSFNKDKFGAGHRRSFSGAIKRLSAAKSSSSSSSSSSFSSSSSSSSSSNNSNYSQYDAQFLKRSSSMSQDIENSIQSAIAHCKRSQQNLHSRKAASETGFCSFSAAASRLVYEDQEGPGLCRG